MANIALNNITKQFRNVTALRDVSFKIYDGEFFVLLGPTGAGKTTSLRIIAGLEKQDAGTKLLIILSDGRPYDHDYGDSRYAREDTKMALRHSKISGITPFCITIDRESEAELKDLYGEVGYTIIDDVMSLPERLPGIYRRLTT